MKIPALARVSIGWELIGKAGVEGPTMILVVVLMEGRLEAGCGKEGPARESIACTDSSTGSVQITHGEELD